MRRLDQGQGRVHDYWPNTVFQLTLAGPCCGRSGAISRASASHSSRRVATRFSIDGFWTYVGATIVVWLVNVVVGWLLDRVRGDFA